MNQLTVRPHTTTTVAHAFVPQTIDEYWRVSEMIYQSGMAPEALNSPQKIMTVIMRGAEVGLTPFMALDKIAYIKGRATIWGDAIPALIRSRGLCHYIKEWIEGEGDAMTAYCETKRVGEDEPCRGSFSVADAKRARLWDEREKITKSGRNGDYTALNDSPWYRFPKRMLQMRARWVLRDVYADLMMGLYIREEIEADESLVDHSLAASEMPTEGMAPAVMKLARAAGEMPPVSTVNKDHIERELATQQPAVEDAKIEEKAAAPTGADPTRYFIHPESGSYWTTTDGTTGHDGTDGHIEEVDYDQYHRFKAEQEEYRAKAAEADAKGVQEGAYTQERAEAATHAPEAEKPASAPASRPADDMKPKPPGEPKTAHEYDCVLELKLAQEEDPDALKAWWMEGSSLRNKLLNMTPEIRDGWKARVTEQIKKLRAKAGAKG